MHRVLQRQLRKLGLKEKNIPAQAQWERFLELISDSYQQADDDRYLLERSLQISSDEMQAMLQQQKASTEGRLHALISALPDMVFMLDEEGCYLEIIAGDHEQFLLPPEDVKGRKINEVMPQEKAVFFMNNIRKALNDNGLQLLQYDLDVIGGHKIFEGRIVPTGLKVNDKRTVVFLARDITELTRTHEQLEHNATHDSLTGLPNRNYLEDRLYQVISRSRRTGRKAAVLLMDLDRFKHINDSLGHNVGDNLLQEVANRLLSSVRAEDSVFRFGGDEFVIIIEDLQAISKAGHAAQHILDSFSKPIQLTELELEVTASIGITITPDDSEDPDMLLRHADNAMYASKEAGRNHYSFYEPALGAKSLVFLSLEANLRKAILNQELELHYQPQYRLIDNRLIGLEALVRWPTAEPEYRRPDAFIPVAEISGLIEPLGLWVIEEACRQAIDWQAKQLNFGRIAINLSSRQLNNPKLASQVEEILKRDNLNGELFEFEITESMVVHEGSTVHNNLESFNKMGIELAIDDFGTGHSSLVNLKRFPLSRLKIDRSFVDGLGDDPNDETITSASIALAQQLGYQIVAEGVETEKQADFLRKHDCDFAQGYLYSAPLPGKEVEPLLPTA